MLSAVRAHVIALLSGQLSLDDFEDWIVASSWHALQNVDEEVRQLVGAIELRLAEHSSGHLDQPDLFAELQALLLHGCALQPSRNVSMSIGHASEFLAYQFTRQPQTSTMTHTASSAKTIQAVLAFTPNGD